MVEGWRWALVSLDGVAPSQMVGVSASVNLPLHHKVQKFSSGTGLPEWSRKKGRKMVVVWYCGGLPPQYHTTPQPFYSLFLGPTACIMHNLHYAIKKNMDIIFYKTQILFSPELSSTLPV